MNKTNNNVVVPTELYKRHRPTRFKNVYGQEKAVEHLTKLLQNRETFPHALMFTGPSGVGKTTLCRILKGKLGCSNFDYREINCAVVEAIETVRDIQSQIPLAPWKGPCRIWLLDEVQSFSRAGFAQQALLKMLEDTPRHVYFFLATTNPEKIINTIHTRCTKIDLSPLTKEALQDTLTHVAKREHFTLSERLRDRIISAADGSAREAVKQLQNAMAYPTEKEQLEAVQRSGTIERAFDLAKALIWGSEKWRDVAAIISGIDEGENWEGIRQMVMSIASKEVLKAGKTAEWANFVLYVFEDKPWHYSGRASLIRCCYEVCSKK